MKANDITCRDYERSGKNGMILILEDIAPDKAITLDWSLINITTDDGDFVEAFAGYQPHSVTLEVMTNYVYLELITGEDAAMLEAMKYLADCNAILQEEIDIQGRLLEAMLEAEEEL